MSDFPPAVQVGTTMSVLKLFSGKQAHFLNSSHVRLGPTGGGEQGHCSPARSNKSQQWRPQLFSSGNGVSK